MKLLRIILLVAAVAAVAALIYISVNRTPESCSETLSPYANCVHYRYSEYKTPLITIVVASGIAFLGTFLIKRRNS